MSLQIIITIDEFEGETWKDVRCKIDEKDIPEFYSYPFTKENSEIESEVELDLTEKGYTW